MAAGLTTADATVEAYFAAAAAGAFDDRRVELLDGRVVDKMGKDPRHCRVTQRLHDVLTAMLPAGYYVRKEDPTALPPNAPEPDLAVVRGTPDDYGDQHPGPDDIVLVVEVADMSLRRDRGTKAAIYAGANIVEYWIANLVDNVIEVSTAPDPAARTYRDRQPFAPGQTVPVVIAGVPAGRVEVNDIL